jgi:hypothetical protein
MQRIEFCKDCYCAKLTVTIEGETPIILLSKRPPLILELEESSLDFIHQMTAPIDERFPFQITRVENTGGFWHYNEPDASNKVDCPMPGTYPATKASDITKDMITDLYWQGNQLLCYFDRKGAYFNNVGTCIYKVFGLNSYRFSDKQGVLYENRAPKAKLTYQVECDACCKDDEIICDSPRFPGYTCYQIPPAAERLLKGKNDISRYWRRQ